MIETTNMKRPLFHILVVVSVKTISYIQNEGERSNNNIPDHSICISFSISNENFEWTMSITKKQFS